MERPRVLLAPTSFKGSLSPIQATKAMEHGFSDFVCIPCPQADGGEGSLECLLATLGGTLEEVETVDPRGNRVTATLGWLPSSVCFVESAQAIGLELTPQCQRDPWQMNSYGLGMMIRAALDRDCQEMWIGLGGSGTVDGGLGLLTALGCRVTDAMGREVLFPHQARGKTLIMDARNLDGRLGKCRIRGLVDVRSPLLGAEGARLFMPQKGASESACAELEHFLEALFHAVFPQAPKTRSRTPGFGAAGGLGMAIHRMGAVLESGSEFMAQKTRLSDHMKTADWVVTGEGMLDAQTLHGKVISRILRSANSMGKPVVMLCGAIDATVEATLRDTPHVAMSIVSGPQQGDWQAMAASNLERTARQVAKIWRTATRFRP